ncbi:MAG: hypothetical protein L6R19_15065 [Alphaproteobacteria bacterium]|nr:hypothetical protein [Alphaproteobacteria bacterium]
MDMNTLITAAVNGVLSAFETALRRGRWRDAERLLCALELLNADGAPRPPLAAAYAAMARTSRSRAGRGGARRRPGKAHGAAVRRPMGAG